MMYLWPLNESMIGMHENFGVIENPRQWVICQGVKEGRKFGVDNDAFNNGFDPDKFFSHLEKLKPYMNQCLFIVCPDEVGDARRTINLWHEWSDKIKKYGPIAFVAQDGQENLLFPKKFNWLFIGGTTDWKMGEGVKECIRRARDMRKPVHVGRVNSIRRFRYFQKLGVDSVDGMSPRYSPNHYRRVYTNAISQLPFHFLISDSNYSS